MVESEGEERRAKNYRRRAKWKAGGRKLKRLREQKGMSQKDSLDKLERLVGKDLFGERHLRKIEAGEARPQRWHLILMLTKVFELDDGQAIDSVLSLYKFGPVTQTDISS